MKPEDFDLIAGIVKSKSGLVLGKDKTYLVTSRLTPVARKHKLADLSALVSALRLRREGELVHDVVEAMTTNETSFFRDLKPFDAFRDVVLPYMVSSRQKQKKLRIWCAACSTGQEPYSLAILLREQGGALANWRFDIVATDLNGAVLERARSGRYTQFEVQRGMPAKLLVKYFRKVDNDWQLNPEIRSAVTFREQNLLGNIGAVGRFDVIFCRNVLIYFDPSTKERVIKSLEGVLEEDGALFLGGAESTVGIRSNLKPVKNVRGCYARADNFVTQFAPAIPQRVLNSRALV